MSAVNPIPIRPTGSAPVRPAGTAPGAGRAASPASATAGGAAETASATRAPAAGLWEILTPEERAFFERQASLGALTYRPGRDADPGAEPAPTGQRLDVKA